MLIIYIYINKNNNNEDLINDIKESNIHFKLSPNENKYLY